MGVLDWMGTQVRAAGGWVADHAGAGPDASAVHSAAPTAATTPAAAPSQGLFGSIMHTIGDFGRGVQQEGVGALLDPRGAVDRQEAQHELASRFNVVAPGTAGAGHNNTVTQEQFQQIARQYSDIRLDRNAVHIDPGNMDAQHAAAFRQGAMGDIASLMQTDSGRALLNDLQTGHNADGSQRQTYIRGISDSDFASDGGHGGGHFGHAGTTHDTDAHHKEGFVDYRPGEVALPGNVDARSDVALAHELTHADASIHDRFATGAVGSADSATAADIAGGVSRSEYQAAGMGTFASQAFGENQYRRDRAAIGASGSGMRDDQGHGDVGMPQRTTYLQPGGSGGSGGSLGAHEEHTARPGDDEG